MSREAFDVEAALEKCHKGTAWQRDLIREQLIAARAAALDEAARVCHHKYMELRHGVDRTDPTDDYEYGLREEIAVELREAIRALKEKL